MIRWKSGTDLVTSEPMPTIAKRPIVRSLPITLPAPIVAPSRTSVGSVCSSGSDGRSCFRSGVVARGNRSLVKMVPALIMTPSSIVTAAHTYTNALILTRLPMRTSYAM